MGKLVKTKWEAKLFNFEFTFKFEKDGSNNLNEVFIKRLEICKNFRNEFIENISFQTNSMKTEYLKRIEDRFIFFRSLLKFSLSPLAFGMDYSVFYDGERVFSTENTNIQITEIQSLIKMIEPNYEEIQHWTKIVVKKWGDSEINNMNKDKEHKKEISLPKWTKENMFIKPEYLPQVIEELISDEVLNPKGELVLNKNEILAITEALQILGLISNDINDTQRNIIFSEIVKKGIKERTATLKGKFHSERLTHYKDLFTHLTK